MRFSILGPLTVTHGDLVCTPTSPKQRQLLALLLTNADCPVSVDACVEELWEDRPPMTARSTLQSHVLHLRRAFARLPGVGSLAGARRILRTTGRGYLLSVAEGELDAGVFDGHMARARAAQTRGDDRLVSAAFADALAVWRGAALDDVQWGPLLQAQVTVLEERRLHAQEQRIEADLRLARHPELIVELSSLTARHPLHENLHAQYMLALYRSGRTADALAVYHQMRAALDEQLGIGPSLRLQRLHTSILTADPSLDLTAPASMPTALDFGLRVG